VLARPLPSGRPVAPRVFEYLFSATSRSGLAGDRGRARERRPGPLGTRAGIPRLAAGRIRAPSLPSSRWSSPPRRSWSTRASPLDGRVRPAVPGPRVRAGRLTGQVPPELVPMLVPAFPVGSSKRLPRERCCPRTGRVRAPPRAVRLDRLPWLLNPLLGGATLLLAWRLADGLPGTTAPAGRALHRGVAGLLGQCDLVLLAGRAPGGVALLRRSGDRGPALSRGVVGSLALALHNPLPHTLFALPWIAWLAWRQGVSGTSCADSWLHARVIVLVGGWMWYRAHVTHPVRRAEGSWKASWYSAKACSPRRRPIC